MVRSWAELQNLYSLHDNQKDILVTDSGRQVPNLRINDTVEIFKDESGEWRWRRTAGNGDILEVSSEGYDNKGDALDMAAQLNTDKFVIRRPEEQGYENPYWINPLDAKTEPKSPVITTSWDQESGR